MRLLFLQARLGLLLALFLGELTTALIWTRRSLLYTLFLAGSLGALGFAQLTPRETTLITHHPSTTLITTELDFWLSALELQPTHRDLLLNAALLTELIDATTAAQYREAARYQDPNNPIFSKLVAH